MINLKALPNQEHNETTELFLRRHWIALVIIGMYELGLGGAPVLFYLMLNFFGSNFLNHPLLGPFSIVLISIYVLVMLLVAMTMFTDFYLDTWIVTTERIINIEQQGLFSRVISTLHLNQIQDVTSETHGLVPTFLSYGNVYVQTAGTRERFNFKQIDNPETVKNVIQRLSEEDKRRHGDASLGQDAYVAEHLSPKSEE